MSEKLTDQQIFDRAFLGMAAQGFRPSVTILATGPVQMQCAYRGESGTKCIIGQVMSDEDYDPRFEGLGITDFYTMDMEDDELQTKADRFVDSIGASRGFMSAFQNLHDSSIDIEQPLDSEENEDAPHRIELVMREFAENYNLTVPDLPA